MASVDMTQLLEPTEDVIVPMNKDSFVHRGLAFIQDEGGQGFCGYLAFARAKGVSLKSLVSELYRFSIENPAHPLVMATERYTYVNDMVKSGASYLEVRGWLSAREDCK